MASRTMRAGVGESAGGSSLGGLVAAASTFVQQWLSDKHVVTRQVMVGAILVLALLAFELFNFDTTEYALEDLLGQVSFAGIRWATILAVAFCSIDFAGLARLLTGDRNGRGVLTGGLVKPTYLLLGAWLLGGGMNALMTWWAVSLALIGHNLGNEVLTRQQLLRMVPVFVAVLVWLTRILIISSFVSTTDGAVERLAREARRREARASARQPHAVRRSDKPAPARPVPSAPAPLRPEPVYVAEETGQASRPAAPARPNGSPPRRPAMPRPPRGTTRPSVVPLGMQGCEGTGQKLV